jgi:hypothetical protein
VSRTTTKCSHTACGFPVCCRDGCMGNVSLWRLRMKGSSRVQRSACRVEQECTHDAAGAVICNDIWRLRPDLFGSASVPLVSVQAGASLAGCAEWLAQCCSAASMLPEFAAHCSRLCPITSTYR